VLPLARPMGRFAVPSALAIGSMVPDLWYFVPLATRDASHGLAGIFWFCLPLGVLAYVLFHLLLKQPLIALLSPRLAAFACAGLPPQRWYAVLASLFAGAATHAAWDALAHLERWLQHASTLAGSAILAVWIARRLARVPRQPPVLSRFARLCILIALGGIVLVAALGGADSAPAFELASLRHFLRTAGLAGLEGLSVALLVYCLVFQRKIPA
jgi:hypothetical protein